MEGILEVIQLTDLYLPGGLVKGERPQLYHWALALCYDDETQNKAFTVDHERRVA